MANATSDGNAFDVYANFLLYLGGLAAATGSGYQQIDTGTYAFAFNPAGVGTSAASLSFAIEANHVYTLYLTGRTGSLTATITQDY